MTTRTRGVTEKTLRTARAIVIDTASETRPVRAIQVRRRALAARRGPLPGYVVAPGSARRLGALPDEPLGVVRLLRLPTPVRCPSCRRRAVGAEWSLVSDLTERQFRVRECAACRGFVWGRTATPGTVLELAGLSDWEALVHHYEQGLLDGVSPTEILLELVSDMASLIRDGSPEAVLCALTVPPKVGRHLVRRIFPRVDPDWPSSQEEPDA